MINFTQIYWMDLNKCVKKIYLGLMYLTVIILKLRETKDSSK